MFKLDLTRRQALALLILAIAIIPLGFLYARSSHVNKLGQDVFYVWAEGQRILHGENPYSRVLQGDMEHNAKYATYFPGYYWLSALTQWLGFDAFQDWMSVWNVVLYVFHLAMGFLIFFILSSCGLTVLGCFGALFWWFNRWSLFAVEYSYLEVIPLFFLVLSLSLFQRREKLSLTLFGISLALKQLAIFLLPIYLIWVWQRERSLRQVAIALALIALPTLVLAAPFLVWDPEGFIKSVAFSATRRGETHILVDGVDDWFDMEGLSARLPMLALMAMVYVGVWQRALGIYLSVLLVMAVFLDFNPVLFRQYFVWTLPFLPLAICDYANAKAATANR